MEDRDTATGLRGLYQDLSALSASSFVNIERLRIELEAHIDDFKKLLDKPAKNNTSRQAVLSGESGVLRLHCPFLDGRRSESMR